MLSHWSAHLNKYFCKLCKYSCKLYDRTEYMRMNANWHWCKVTVIIPPKMLQLCECISHSVSELCKLGFVLFFPASCLHGLYWAHRITRDIVVYPDVQTLQEDVILLSETKHNYSVTLLMTWFVWPTVVDKIRNSAGIFQPSSRRIILFRIYGNILTNT